MKFIITILMMFWPTITFAHFGHLGDMANHDHWTGAAAIGTAIALGVWGALKGHKTSEDVNTGEGAKEEVQDA